MRFKKHIKDFWLVYLMGLSAITFGVGLFLSVLYVLYLGLCFVASVFLPNHDAHEAGLAMLFILLALSFVTGSSTKKT